ncbi:hypothetical protein [Psychromonas algicola]|uniref:hypothetical protein n=1 Tax=Psychromonas algicola TaxID=2555642 RepID=UPI0010673430|nr:hypothetical protein [Psychromonas sp. RZ5]TEW44306.1 hypothetical protein E2R67_15055 [Psychromonas sp. RZ5]
MDRIILVAQQLAKEGKTPNTASIKARLPKNTPLPAIIQGLKLWQADPNKQIEVPTEPSLTGAVRDKNENSIDSLITNKIEQAIAPLKDEINNLKSQIKILQSQIKITAEE